MIPSIEILKRDRPRSLLVRGSGLAFLALAVWSWTSGDIQVGDLLSARRMDNLERFLREDIVPFPMRGRPFELEALAAWAGDLLSSRGLSGSLQTLAISVLAIALAGLGAVLLAPFAARNVASHDPFPPPNGPERAPVDLEGAERGRARWRRRAWTTLGTSARAFLILLRAIPEYVWAFLLLAILGPNAWPAVLALAIHNAGILGKLGAETIENLESAPLRALRGLGAGRAQVTLAAAVPLALPRFLLYFSYRFETCVREATVLGLLGVVSLGYWIQDARGRHYHDEMLFFVALGAGIVLLGDLTSAVVRAFLRRAT
ncbi:MAG: PhnE/PtxC family ABC transporter permease [Planctomycetota bacterium]